LPVATQAEDVSSILENLPAPEVKYQKAPVNSYPEPATPQKKAIQYPVKKAVNEIPSKVQKEFPGADIVEDLTNNKTVKSLSSLVDHLTDPAKKSQSQNAGQSKEINFKAPPKIDKSKIKVVEKDLDVYEGFLAFKNIVDDNLNKQIYENLNLVTEVIEQSQKFQQKQKEKDKDKAEKEAQPEEELTGKFDSVFAKAKVLRKKENWKALARLFQDNQEAGETQEGLEYRIEAEINSDKPNYYGARRLASSLIKDNRRHPLANYAMALYYYNAKRPNPKKASSHLNIALKAKNPPAGASKLYWITMLKKFWLGLVIVIAGIIGGIDYLRKKKKADAPEKTEDKAETAPDNKDEPTKSEEDKEKEPIASDSGKLGKLKSLVSAKLELLTNKLKPIIDKIKKKKNKTEDIKLEEAKEDPDSEEEDTSNENSDQEKSKKAEEPDEEAAEEEEENEESDDEDDEEEEDDEESDDEDDDEEEDDEESDDEDDDEEEDDEESDDEDDDEEEDDEESDDDDEEEEDDEESDDEDDEEEEDDEESDDEDNEEEEDDEESDDEDDEEDDDGKETDTGKK
ncbi:MAG: hypothetical protein ACQETH_05910, partial [Candidatus Rifleibacteriota bacterium]